MIIAAIILAPIAIHAARGAPIRSLPLFAVDFYTAAGCTLAVLMY